MILPYSNMAKLFDPTNVLYDCLGTLPSPTGFDATSESRRRRWSCAFRRLSGSEVRNVVWGGLMPGGCHVGVSIWRSRTNSPLAE